MPLITTSERPEPGGDASISCRLSPVVRERERERERVRERERASEREREREEHNSDFQASRSSWHNWVRCLTPAPMKRARVRRWVAFHTQSPSNPARHSRQSLPHRQPPFSPNTPLQSPSPQPCSIISKNSLEIVITDTHCMTNDCMSMHY